MTKPNDGATNWNVPKRKKLVRGKKRKPYTGPVVVASMSKGRKVRTPAGARRFDLPIGSPIVGHPDAPKMPRVRAQRPTSLPAKTFAGIQSHKLLPGVTVYNHSAKPTATPQVEVTDHGNGIIRARFVDKSGEEHPVKTFATNSAAKIAAMKFLADNAPAATKAPAPRKAAAPKKRAAPKIDAAPWTWPKPKPEKADGVKLHPRFGELTPTEQTLADRSDDEYKIEMMLLDSSDEQSAPATAKQMRRIHTALPLAKFLGGYDEKGDFKTFSEMVHPTTLAALADEAELFSENYPLGAKYLQSIGFGKSESGPAFAYVTLDDSSAHLRLELVNEPKDSGFVKEQLDAVINPAGQWRVGYQQPLRSVFRHEFAHVLQARERQREFAEGRPNPGTYANMAASFTAPYGRIGMHRVPIPRDMQDFNARRKVSRYATSNQWEFGAEVWALAHLDGKLDRSRVPEEFRDLFDSMVTAANTPLPANSIFKMVKKMNNPVFVLVNPAGPADDQPTMFVDGKPVMPETTIHKAGTASPYSTPKEIAGHHGHHPHGKSIRWPAMYEHLLAKGMSKSKAAAISNAAWKKKRMGIPTNTPMSARGVAKTDGTLGPDFKMVSKLGHVRTIAGQRKYGVPIGTPITREMKRLRRIRENGQGGLNPDLMGSGLGVRNRDRSTNLRDLPDLVDESKLKGKKKKRKLFKEEAPKAKSKIGDPWTDAGIVNPQSPAIARLGVATADDLPAEDEPVEKKYRKVDSIAGVRRYHAPIGTPITPQMKRKAKARDKKSKSKDLLDSSPLKVKTKTHGVGVGAAMTVQSKVGETAREKNDRIFKERETYKPDPKGAKVAADYRKANGLPEPDFGEDGLLSIPADYDRAYAVAKTFLTKGEQQSPERQKATKAAYRDLVAQVGKQLESIKAAGVEIEYLSPDEIKKLGDPNGENPYPTALAQQKDVQAGHLKIASIADYTSGENAVKHPYLDLGRGGEYDQFRAVHDYFGHAAAGTGFDRHGEFEAWLHHTSMFSGPGRQAASSELHMENSTLVVTGAGAPHNAFLLPKSMVDPFEEDGTFKGEAWVKDLSPLEGKPVEKAEELDEITGEIVKVDTDKRTVFGWAYVAYDQLGELNVDGSGEFVDDVEELEKAAYNFVLGARTGDADHTNEVKSTMIESMVFTPEKIEAMGLKKGDLPLAWWTGWKIHDNDVWEGVKKGEYASFSIFGRSTKKDVTP